MKQRLTFFKPLATRKGVFVPETPYEGNKNLLKFVEEHYKCAQSDLLNVKKRKLDQGQHKLSIPRLKSGDESDDVPAGFFLTIIFSIQGSIHDITKYLTLYSKFGPWMALLLFACIYVFIAMPLYMVFFFLSNYTRFGYMKIWSAVPILKGVSFSVAMLNFVSCILNMSLVTLHIVFMCGAFTNWLECGYPYEEGTECLSNQTNFCTERNMPMPQVGTYVFMKHVVNSKFGDVINFYWILILFVMYTLLVLGELYARRVLAPICRLTTIMWGLIFITIILYEGFYGTTYTLTAQTSGTISTILQPPFWVACAKLSLRRVMPGDLVTYGSITMAGMNPITMAVLMALMRIVFTTTVANFYVISLNRFITYHNIKYADCVEVNGLTILFCLIPDQLLQIDATKITYFLYLLFSIYMGSMSTFLSIHGFLTAITGDYPDTKEYRTTVVIIICVIMFLANIVVVGVGFEFLFFEDLKVFIAPLLTYCCVAFFMTSYSPLRIANDFYFAFGRRLPTYWNTLMKLYVIFVSAISTIYIMYEMHNMPVDGSVWANIVALLLILTPIVLFAIIRIHLARKNKKKISMIQPGKGWGSPDAATRAARISFDAKRECRMRMELRCHHECLVESKTCQDFLTKEMDKYFMNRNRYVVRMSKEKEE